MQCLKRAGDIIHVLEGLEQADDIEVLRRAKVNQRAGASTKAPIVEPRERSSVVLEGGHAESMATTTTSESFQKPSFTSSNLKKQDRGWIRYLFKSVDRLAKFPAVGRIARVTTRNQVVELHVASDIGNREAEAATVTAVDLDRLRSAPESPKDSDQLAIAVRRPVCWNEVFGGGRDRVDSNHLMGVRTKAHRARHYRQSLSGR